VARNITSRFHLHGTLVTQSPLHVGGHGEEVDTDLPLARDGAGQLYVPGTSLAGALRQWCEAAFDDPSRDYGVDRKPSERVWGFQEGDRGHASFVVVEDAVIKNFEMVIVEIRDHVGIDREYGAAAEHIKYDRAILPRGTILKLQLTVEVEKQEKRNLALAMLAALKQALEAGEVCLGAAKTRGLGHVKLTEAQLTEQVLGTRQGILALLKQANGSVVSPTDIDAAKQDHPAQKRPRLTLKIHWKPAGPLMVKAGFDGIAADMLPLVSGCDGQVSLVLPGSSVKGAFRSQAERIVRTVLGDVRPNWLGTEGKKKFLDAVKLPLINELFGAAKQTSTKPELGLGALGVIDCFGQHRLTVAQWQAIQAATDDRQLRQALTAAGLQPWSQAYHVAIDRWLGAAAESMLYTMLEPHRTEWEPLTLEVNLQRLTSDVQLPGLALLLLVVRDLANDRLPLGFATHRGMGTVQVTGLDIQGHDLEGDLVTLEHIQIHNGKLQNLPDVLTTAWQQWVTQNREVPA
jgi:CRISPR/Cas system CSM-associated protein Csm3 (group 7 of RAMP superfamily)